MDLVSIALVVVALWIGVVVFVVAMSKASGNADADADAERYFAESRDDVPDQSQAPYSDVAPGDDRRSIDAAELEREAKRLGIERRRLHLPRLVGTHRHR